MDQQNNYKKSNSDEKWYVKKWGNKVAIWLKTVLSQTQDLKIKKLDVFKKWK